MKPVFFHSEVEALRCMHRKIQGMQTKYYNNEEFNEALSEDILTSFNIILVEMEFILMHVTNCIVEVSK